MNSKIKFEGTINGRTYTDEKVFQYALRDAIAKGEDIEVSATSTAIDQPAEPEKEWCEDFKIAISPDKIAANLEVSDDRNTFLCNLEQGLAAVVDQFNDALAENHINKAKAYEVLNTEIAGLNERLETISQFREDLRKKQIEYESKANAVGNSLAITADTMSAFKALQNAYAEMASRVKPADFAVPGRKPCNGRNCEPKTMSELMEDFVNLFR